MSVSITLPPGWNPEQTPAPSDVDDMERERLALRERQNTERYQRECEEHAKMLMRQVISDHMDRDSLREAFIQKMEEERGFTWGEGFMNTGEFRIMRENARCPLLLDQHVGHIISRSRHGADHSDNYIVVSAALNMSVGDRNDSCFAEIAGLEQTKRAVAVSRITGYKGPGAEELIAIAKAARTAAARPAAPRPAAPRPAVPRPAAPRPAVRRPARNVRVPTKHVKVRLAKKEYSLCI
jgi:hypothetical protein